MHRPSGRVDTAPTSRQLYSSCTQTLTWEQTAQFRHVNQQLKIFSTLHTDSWEGSVFVGLLRQHKCTITVYSEWQIQNFPVCAVNHIAKLKFSTLSSVMRSEILRISSFGRLTNISFLVSFCSISALIQKYFMLSCPRTEHQTFGPFNIHLEAAGVGEKGCHSGAIPLCIWWTVQVNVKSILIRTRNRR